MGLEPTPTGHTGEQRGTKVLIFMTLLPLEYPLSPGFFPEFFPSRAAPTTSRLGWAELTLPLESVPHNRVTN